MIKNNTSGRVCRKGQVVHCAAFKTFVNQHWWVNRWEWNPWVFIVGCHLFQLCIGSVIKWAESRGGHHWCALLPQRSHLQGQGGSGFQVVCPWYQHCIGHLINSVIVKTWAVTCDFCPKWSVLLHGECAVLLEARWAEPTMPSCSRLCWAGACCEPVREALLSFPVVQICMCTVHSKHFGLRAWLPCKWLQILRNCRRPQVSAQLGWREGCTCNSWALQFAPGYPQG